MPHERADHGFDSAREGWVNQDLKNIPVYTEADKAASLLPDILSGEKRPLLSSG